MITKSRPTGERLRKQNGVGRLSRAGHPTLRGLDGVDGDLAGAAVLGGVEGDLLALDEAAQARALQRGGVDEHVLGAVVRLDEAEAFLVVVEFHGARNHRGVLFAGGARKPKARKRGRRRWSSMFGRESEPALGQAKAKRPDRPAKCRSSSCKRSNRLLQGRDQRSQSWWQDSTPTPLRKAAPCGREP